MYDWSSFPMGWQRIEATRAEQAVPRNGSYAFRVRPKLATASGVWPSWREQREEEKPVVVVRFGVGSIE